MKREKTIKQYKEQADILCLKLWGEYYKGNNPDCLRRIRLVMTLLSCHTWRAFPDYTFADCVREARAWAEESAQRQESTQFTTNKK